MCKGTCGCRRLWVSTVGLFLGKSHREVAMDWTGAAAVRVFCAFGLAVLVLLAATSAIPAYEQFRPTQADNDKKSHQAQVRKQNKPSKDTSHKQKKPKTGG